MSYYYGPIEPSDLVRSAKGTSCIYELDSRSDMTKFQSFMTSYAVRIDGKVICTGLFAFTSQGDPMYLTKVTVRKKGRDRAKRGRK